MTEETPSLRMDFTPDEIVAGIARAVEERELEVVPGLVKYLATKDPHRAGEVLDALKGRITRSPSTSDQCPQRRPVMSEFKTSSFCSQHGCVEVELADGPPVVATPTRPVEGNCDPTNPVYARVRSTKDHTTVLEFDRAEWEAFVAGVRAGEFGGDGGDE